MRVSQLSQLSQSKTRHPEAQALPMRCQSARLLALVLVPGAGGLPQVMGGRDAPTMRGHIGPPEN